MTTTLNIPYDMKWPDQSTNGTMTIQAGGWGMIERRGVSPVSDFGGPLEF